MKRIFLMFLSVLLVFSSAGCASENFSVAAKGACLIDCASGRILFAQNADEILPNASTTKLMTALVAVENAALNEAVTAGKNASGVPGTSMYLGVGETLTMEEMLFGLLLRSGNDAAVAIAEHVSGSMEVFTEEMNARAAEIGADAHFLNPHGLDQTGHGVSALGLARILAACLKNADIRRICTTKRQTVPWVGNEFSRVLENKNRLLTDYAGALGGKTGYTSRAGRCLAFSAERGGLMLAGSVLNCPTWFDTAEDLLDYGFENFRAYTPLKKGQTVCRKPVARGMEPAVFVVAASDLSAAIGINEHACVTYDFGSGLAAPIREGQVVGTAKIQLGGETVAQCDLLAAGNIDRRTLGNALKYVLTRWVSLFEE